MTFAIRSDNLDALSAAARREGVSLQGPVAMSRDRLDGVRLDWTILYLEDRRFGEAIPFVIDWGTSPHLTHAGQLWWLDCLQRYWPTPAETRALVAVPLYHKNAMAGAIKPMLAAGGSVVLLPNFKPARFLRALSDYRCTHAGGVPAVFTLLLQERDLIPTLHFSSLKGLKIGSAPTPKELLDAVEAAFGAPVTESYGLTEGGPVMIGPPVDGRPSRAGAAAWCGRRVKSNS
jgi:acyl-CoA synthetase (AMP-forming)/AMP-acid ligase II